MPMAVIDRLMDMCDRHAGTIAELWYGSLSKNPRTQSYNLISKEGALRHALTFYKNIRQMYFAEDCFKEVERVLDVSGFAEDFFARGIPLEQLIYALILLRRHIWLYADSQALYETALTDMYEAVQSINRILLIFDYATYIVTYRYHQMAIKVAGK